MSRKTTWIVQTNLGSTSGTAEALRRACAAEELPFEEVQVVAFSDELPTMPEIGDGSFVLYGRTTLLMNAWRDPHWQRGLFFDPDLFRPETYAAHYGARMLNADARILTFSEFVSEDHPDDRAFFVKPNDDLKHFTGDVMRFGDVKTWVETFQDAIDPDGLTPNSQIAVAEPREIDAEWRLFILAGRVVTGSLYRPNANNYLPPEVIEFAEEAVSLWEPSAVFALDVARVEGTYKIVECNCFNGCAFYASDLHRLVRTISRYQQSVW